MRLVTGIYPAKEGLKRPSHGIAPNAPGVTGIYPAKEGLKLTEGTLDAVEQECYRHLSSKRRIETNRLYVNSVVLVLLPAFIQQKKD